MTTTQDVCYPGTPYMYHYYIQSLIDCGMNLEAKEALVNYWGGMIAKEADTFGRHTILQTTLFLHTISILSTAIATLGAVHLFILSGNTLKYFRSEVIQYK